MNIIPRSLYTLLVLLLFTAVVSADSSVPGRALVDAKVAEMLEYAENDNYKAWAEYFAEDGSFTNSMMPEPIVGRDAIIEFAGTWPEAETVIEWRVTEGNRMVMGWRERRPLGEGKWSDWYRGYSSFVFNADGEVQAYEGMFDPMAMKAALQPGQ